jgi:putative NADPH-quinone reductase
MKFHIIIDHPRRDSFNHAVMHSFIEGLKANRHDFNVLDLNEEKFNPVMSEDELSIYSRGGFTDPKVGEYQQRLKNADHLVLIFPIWWMVMPGRMKGWMDKVLLPGFAFSSDEIPKPLLSHISAATVFTTTAVADAIHRKEFNNALEWVLCKGTLNFIGIKHVTWKNFGEAGYASREKHATWLGQVKDYAMQL